ncbi:hypothetical protein Tco_0529297 [Tanacetum coccineum]
MSHANEPWQVAAAVAAVRSARDEKIVFYLTEYKESALVYWHVEIGIRALGYRELACQAESMQQLHRFSPSTYLPGQFPGTQQILPSPPPLIPATTGAIPP